MTTDEFERIQVAVRNMACLQLPGKIYVDFKVVMEIIHSHMHQEDRDAYRVDDSLRYVRSVDKHE